MSKSLDKQIMGFCLNLEELKGKIKKPGAEKSIINQGTQQMTNFREEHGEGRQTVDSDALHHIKEIRRKFKNRSILF